MARRKKFLHGVKGGDGHGFRTTNRSATGCNYDCFWGVTNFAVSVITKRESCLCVVQYRNGNFSLVVTVVAHFRQSCDKTTNSRIRTALIKVHGQTGL